MKTRRPTKIYLLIMVLILALGLPARMIQDRLPSWYVQYFGDYLWAMLLFFGFALIFQKMSTFKVAIATLFFTYCIEVSGLFHPYQNLPPGKLRDFELLSNSWQIRRSQPDGWDSAHFSSLFLSFGGFKFRSFFSQPPVTHTAGRLKA